MQLKTQNGFKSSKIKTLVHHKFGTTVDADTLK